MICQPIFPHFTKFILLSFKYFASFANEKSLYPFIYKGFRRSEGL